jgi:proteic killer suppression protein
MRFKDKDIEAFWNDPVSNTPTRVPPDVRKMLYRKLQMLEAVSTINDLRIPPGNRLEKLKGSGRGQFSIRVNDQWRLCFVWDGLEAREVEFDDYH